ncbi:MAG: hypothetical protein A9183_07235 [Dehalococcoides mccartyi]|uniref:hypothetical protein n=1 Tax=Dehalococcoides mccartyi TaxID=61435 RepID=UPI00080581B0|nr:hypothetical protein [Dehalococcoides mccartyi]OBW63506.1 MAG: hypothetical protein A9183_07235 [Dehalococcoides mccartyi]
MISQAKLVDLLKSLPAVHLELLDLTWQLTGEDGALDPQKISFHYTEMEKAIAEAESYSRSTREMVQCLTRLLH